MWGSRCSIKRGLSSDTGGPKRLVNCCASSSRNQHSTNPALLTLRQNCGTFGFENSPFPNRLDLEDYFHRGWSPGGRLLVALTHDPHNPQKGAPVQLCDPKAGASSRCYFRRVSGLVETGDAIRFMTSSTTADE
jgi:hypothetical protein